RESTLGSEHVDTWAVTRDLAWLLRDMGRYDRAEPLFRRILADSRKKFPPGHTRPIDDENHLGWCLALAGQHAEAERHLLDSYRSLQAAKGAPPDWPPIYRERLAELYHRWGNPEKAEPLLRQQLDFLRCKAGADSPAVARA